jgi:exonuclease VII small subunit
LATLRSVVADRNAGIGEFEQGVHELHRCSHALAEAIDEFRRYSGDERGSLAKLHFRQGLSAIELAENRLAEAKRKLNSFRRKEVKVVID